MVNEQQREPGTAFEKRAREVFDESLEHIDARTRSKLTQARHAALAELSSDRVKSQRWHWLIPASSVATVAVVAVMVVVMRGPHSLGHEPSSSIEDLEIVAADDNIDMLQDVDFYAWIDTDEHATTSLDSST